MDSVAPSAASLQDFAVVFEFVFLVALSVVVALNKFCAVSAVPIAAYHELLVVALQVVTAEELIASWLTFEVLPDLAHITVDGVAAVTTVVLAAVVPLIVAG